MAQKKAAPSIDTIRVDFPEKSQMLFRSAPYKVQHGGRGGSKSWSFVRAMLLLGGRRKLTILCAREFQKSIDESVHKLICSQIDLLGMGHFYTWTKTKILGANGTEFVFAGIRNNIRSIKSMEAIDICAVFEAAPISHTSWEMLLPTVRRDPPFGPFGMGSEVWVEFNPEDTEDETYKRFVLKPPDGALVDAVNYWDNPWFPEVLRKQMEQKKRDDFDEYLHVWCGQPRAALKGAIYSKEILQAIEEKRIGPNIKWQREHPVIISFDLGRSDACVATVWQQFGVEHHVVGCYGNVGYDFSHYIEEINDRGYTVAKIMLPHDAEHEHLAAKKTITRQAREAFPNAEVQVVHRIPNVTLGINYVRQLFRRMYFAEGPTSDLMTALRRYRFKVEDDNKTQSAQPLHDWTSNYADSIRTYAEGLRDVKKDTGDQQRKARPSSGREARGLSWMGN